MVPRASSSSFFLTIVLFPFLSVFPSPSSSAPSCISVDYELCNTVLATYSTPSLVYQLIPTQVALTIETMNAELVNMTKVLPILGPDCYDVARRFVCASLLKECLDGTQPSPPCQGLCLDFHHECDFFLNGTNLDGYLPACSTLPTTNCTCAANAVPLDRSTVECPAPLIRNPDPSVARETCPGGICCVACPFATSFYPEGELERSFKAIVGTNVVFSFFAFATLVVYLIIPAKRKFPQNIVLFMSLSIMIVYIIFYVAMVPPEDLLCVSEVETAVAGSAHLIPLCSFQGTLLVYGVLASILWFSVLGINVFLFVATKATVPNYVQYIYHAICWGLPTIPIIILNVKQEIGTAAAPICGIPNEDYENGALFIPSAVVIFPSFILLLVVYFKVIMIARSLKKNFWEVVKAQFRPLLFATYAIAVYIMFWGYLLVDTDHLNPNWKNDWAYCIAMGYGQTACAEVASIAVPKLSTMMGVYIMVGSLGLMAFLAFVLKQDVYVELVRVITGRQIGTALGSSMDTRTSNTKRSTKGTAIEDEIDRITKEDSIDGQANGSKIELTEMKKGQGT